ncbi:hypothetical protein LTR08_008455 [Meristemomyces frigidus]|nr:hypothetical protein LTR08_008455 [Meristemomyces frigidus]
MALRAPIPSTAPLRILPKPQHPHRRLYTTQSANTPTSVQGPPGALRYPHPHSSNTIPIIKPPPRGKSKNWPPSDAGIKYILFGSLFAIPGSSWVYYEYRKEHMDRKREEMLREVQERWRAKQLRDGA